MKKKKIARGAVKLLHLVASDMANTDHPRYVMQLRQISQNKTLHRTVRNQAARMVEKTYNAKET